MSSGASKMYLMNRTMEFRREHPELFARGDYIPLNVTGPRANHVIAFARAHDGKRAIVAVGRFFMQLPEAPPLPVNPDVWAETFIELDPGAPVSMMEVITGRSISIVDGRLAVREAFAQLPAAMLHH
jgi:(1->4)-alpha-D-glucan 1-alpha-D-glucosylmutase